MQLYKILEDLLPVATPLQVERVEKDEASQEVHIHLKIAPSYRPAAGQVVHQYYDRKWEHLPLFQYRCFIHCRLPVYKDTQTSKTHTLQVGFSREQSRFTLLYEQQVMKLIRLYHNITKVAEQLGVYPQRIASIYHHYTEEAYQTHCVSACRLVGIDETAAAAASTRKGHDYITAFVDLDTHQIIDLQDGKGADTIAQFFQNHPNPAVIQNISSDMSPAFAKGVQAHFPWVRVTYDKWHVFKLLGKHLDKLTDKHPTKQVYAVLLAECLVNFYRQVCLERAQAQLCFMADWAEEIFGKNPFSKSIRKHFDGIVAHIRSRLTNGVLEGVNSKIQTIKRVAKGFRYTDNFKKMILFVFGTIRPQCNTT
ncbi:MAG: transposase [Bacteroidota bacterium]